MVLIRLASEGDAAALAEVYRPYVEDTDFWGTNPGLNWQIADNLNLDVQGNYTRSEFRRESRTGLFAFCPGCCFLEHRSTI